VTERQLRYSERLEIAETGALAPFEFDDVPGPFRRAFAHLLDQASDAKHVGVNFSRRFASALIEHFGLDAPIDLPMMIARYPTAQFLDLAEIAREAAEDSYRYEERQKVPGGFRLRPTRASPMANFATRFNHIADRHRLGYRMESGEILRVGSPALTSVVVGPALLAAQKPGWDQVERSYREALRHQRGGTDENDDALTAAAASLESALKAAGFTGSTLSRLSSEFKASSLAAPQLRGVPDLLQDLLTRAGAMRNIHGDAHGRSPGDSPTVTHELVDLAIHLTGSFIVYLATVAAT
jgi:hypothetical protein